MFRKLLPFSLILLIAIPMFAVLYSPAAAAPAALRPSRTPTKTKTPTNTPTPVVPSATPTPAGSWIVVTAPNGGEVLTNGDVYSISWLSSADIEFVEVVIGQRSLCVDCGAYWNTEFSTGPIENTGSFDWTVSIEEPVDKQIFVMVSGGSYDGINFNNSIVLAMDVSDRPFTILEDPLATPTWTEEPTVTSSATLTATDTSTPTDEPIATFTATFTPTDEPTATWTPLPSTFTPTPTRTRTPTRTPVCADC
jgi:hypothetical protein